MTEFFKYSSDTQTRLYDYLKNIGIGDGTARFVNEYNELYTLYRKVQIIKQAEDFFAHPCELNKN